jgi:hypothetical protein
MENGVDAIEASWISYSQKLKDHFLFYREVMEIILWTVKMFF